MKRIIIISALFFSMVSLGWEITNEQVQMSEMESKQFFGNNNSCGVLGYNYLSLALISEGRFNKDSALDMENFINNQINIIGEELRKENPNTELSDYELASYYYAYKCRIPSNGELEQWGSPTFIKAMEELRKVKNILKTKHNDVQP